MDLNAQFLLLLFLICGHEASQPDVITSKVASEKYKTDQKNNDVKPSSDPSRDKGSQLLKCNVKGKAFNCSDMMLKEFPENIPAETTAIDLGNNLIDSVPRNRIFESVVTLSLQDNELSTVEEDPFHEIFPQLSQLDLSGNGIAFPPHNLPKSIVKLDLDRNRITSINTDYMGTLEQLFIQENDISGSVSLCNMDNRGCHKVKSLKTLALSSNKINLLEDDGMTGFDSLKVLSLKNNKIRRLSSRALRGASALTLLDLSWNNIHMIEEDTFKNCKFLTYLYLNQNKLKTIPSALPLLEWFDISHNKITFLNETLKTVLYPIEMVNLGQNPFHCDCHMLWLKEWYDRREYIIDYSTHIDPDEYIPSCATPHGISGEQWSNLADEVFVCGLNTEELQDTKPSSKKHISEDLDLDPYGVIGENPKYIQTYDLHVQVRSVQPTAVTLEWRAPPHYTNLVIQYFISTSEVETTLFSQVQASQGHFILKNLESESLYVICVMPKTETLSLTAPLDDCVQVITGKDVDQNPKGIFEGILSFHMDHTLASKCKLILGCLIVSVVIVACGLLLAEGFLRMFGKPDKDHDD